MAVRLSMTGRHIMVGEVKDGEIRQPFVRFHTSLTMCC